MSTYPFKRVYQVDSHKRLSGSTSDFTTSLVLDGLTTGASTEHLAIVLTACSIPKSFYNCRAGRNTFTVTEGAVTTTITVPPGNYSIPQFKVAIIALLNATGNGNVFAATFSTITCKLSFTVAPGPASFTMPASTGNGIHDLFGLLSASTTALPFVSPNVTRSSSQTTLQVRTNLVATNDNILQAIYAPEFISFSTIVYITTDLDARAKPLATLNSAAARFYITDETEQPVDLNGLSMTLTVMIYKPLEYSIRDFIRMKFLSEQEDSPLDDIDSTLKEIARMMQAAANTKARRQKQKQPQEAIDEKAPDDAVATLPVPEPMPVVDATN